MNASIDIVLTRYEKAQGDERNSRGQDGLILALLSVQKDCHLIVWEPTGQTCASQRRVHSLAACCLQLEPTGRYACQRGRCRTAAPDLSAAHYASAPVTVCTYATVHPGPCLPTNRLFSCQACRHPANIVALSICALEDALRSLTSIDMSIVRAARAAQTVQGRLSLQCFMLYIG